MQIFIAGFFPPQETLAVRLVIFYRDLIERVTFLFAVRENASGQRLRAAGWLRGLSISVQVTVVGLLRVIGWVCLDASSLKCRKTERSLVVSKYTYTGDNISLVHLLVVWIVLQSV